MNTGDTTFMMLATAMVCLMTPGLAFFYGGLARKRSVLYIMMQSFMNCTPKVRQKKSNF